MIFCEKYKAYVEKQHKCKGWKCITCYEQICNINQHQCFIPMIKTPEAGQGYSICDMEHMQETRTHVLNCIFAMELAPDAPWDEEGAERKTEGEWNFKGDTCLMDFIGLCMDTKF